MHDRHADVPAAFAGGQALEGFDLLVVVKFGFATEL